MSPAVNRAAGARVAPREELRPVRRPRAASAAVGRPASSRPPASATRSRSPARPRPAPGPAAPSARAGPVSRSSTTRSSPAAPSVTCSSDPGAWRSAFVTPSWTVR